METCLNVLTDDLYYNYMVMESWRDDAKIDINKLKDPKICKETIEKIVNDHNTTVDIVLAGLCSAALGVLMGAFGFAFSGTWVFGPLGIKVSTVIGACTAMATTILAFNTKIINYKRLYSVAMKASDDIEKLKGLEYDLKYSEDDGYDLANVEVKKILEKPKDYKVTKKDLKLVTDAIKALEKVEEAFNSAGKIAEQNAKNKPIEESCELILEKGVDDLLKNRIEIKEFDISSPAAIERTIEKIANRTGKGKEAARKSLGLFLINLIPAALFTSATYLITLSPYIVVLYAFTYIVTTIAVGISISTDKWYYTIIETKITTMINELDEIEKWSLNVKDYYNKQDQKRMYVKDLGDNIADIAKKYGITKASDITSKKLNDIKKTKAELSKCLIIINNAKKNKHIKKINAESVEEFSGLLTLELLKEEQNMFNSIYAHQYALALTEHGLFNQELIKLMEEHSLFNWKNNHSKNNIVTSHDDKMDIINNISEVTSFVKSIIDINNISESAMKGLQKDYINSEINAIPICAYDDNYYNESVVDKLNESFTNQDIVFYADNGYISIGIR